MTCRVEQPVLTAATLEAVFVEVLREPLFLAEHGGAQNIV